MRKVLTSVLICLLPLLPFCQNPLEMSRWREAIPQDSLDDPWVYQFNFMKKGELTATRVQYKWSEGSQKWQGVTAEQFCDGRGDSYKVEHDFLQVMPREKHSADEDLIFKFEFAGDTLILRRGRIWTGNPEGLFGVWHNHVYAEGLPNNLRSQKIELTKDFKLITYHRSINDTNKIQLSEDRWVETVSNRNSKSVCPPETQEVFFKLIGDRLYTYERKAFAKLIRRAPKKD